MKNKYILLCTFMLLVFGELSAQQSLEKALKKLAVPENELVSSNESIFLFPTGFLYSSDQPDSIIYLGCLSTDRQTFQSAFEQKNETFFFPAGSKINRIAGDTAYRIPIETLANKRTHLNKPALIDSSANYVLLYYWNPLVLDKYLIKNYLFFKKYGEKHPEYNIQVVPVLVE